MIMLNSTTALVSNTDDLQEAVGNNDVDYIFFGADITLAYGITIYPDKTALVIDGTYNGVRYSFTDIEGISSTQTLGIRAASSIQLTFRNITMYGRNYYGIPYVSEAVNTDNVTVAYENVTYTGKQVIYHQRGLTRFIDCDITIAGTPSTQVEEVGQICKVEIGGRTTMYKENDEDAIFWFFGNSTRKPYLKILTGADVSISTEHYFMYELEPPDIIIEPDAKFTLNTNSGFSWDISHTAASFLVGENASFRYTQQTQIRNTASLCLSGSLTVNEGASFYMQADFENNNPLIRFTSSSAGLYINNPKSFALYNRGNANATAFYFAANIPAALTGGQLNYWTEAALFPIAGTFEDIPLHKWNRNDWNIFTISCTAGRTATTNFSSDFTAEELIWLPPLTDLQLHSAQVFSLGNLPLSVDRVVVGRPITGITDPLANVKVEYTTGVSWSTVADEDGQFSLIVDDPVPFSQVESSSNTPFLIVTVMESAEEEELIILRSPQKIKFLIRPMPGFTEIILPREFPDEPVVVLDTRTQKTEWTLWARITGPLMTADNDVLDDGVIFMLPEGSPLSLGTDFSPVHTDGPYTTEDEHSVVWAENRGVLARITVPMRSGKEYSTQLIWEVMPAGIHPDALSAKPASLPPVSRKGKSR